MRRQRNTRQLTRIDAPVWRTSVVRPSMVYVLKMNLEGVGIDGKNGKRRNSEPNLVLLPTELKHMPLYGNIIRQSAFVRVMTA